MNNIATLCKRKLSKERGIIKKDWGGKLSVALLYPNYYRLGMSNLGFQAVYKILNDDPRIVSERAFLPETQEMYLHKRFNYPLLSLESQKPLSEFDIIAFSLSFENDYLNCLTMLDLCRFPIESKDRGDDYPLIAAGGILTFMNPEPLSDVIDCFLIGEGDVILKEFFNVYLDLKLYSEKKENCLKVLAKNVAGVYCPSLYKVEYNEEGFLASFEPLVTSVPSKVKAVKKLPFGGPLLRSQIITPFTEFSDTILVEIARGCGYSCRFCAAGYVYRPPRTINEGEIKTSLQKILAETPKLGIISPSASDVPGIEEITSFIIENGGEFSLSSLRADSLTEELINNLKKSRQKTLTIAPETGSDRLRIVINKKMTTRDIIDAIILITRTGFFHIKLYFLVGLPTENREDIQAIVSMAKSIRHHIIKECRGRKKISRIRLSINCFIPKPFTPFQWFPMETVESLKEKQRLIKKSLSEIGGVGLSFDVPKWAYVQTLLSIGDRRVGKMLLTAYKNNGNWIQAFRSSSINPDFFVYREKDLFEKLPWDFIDNNIKKSFLQDEYNLALASVESPSCNVGSCTRCGVCK